MITPTVLLLDVTRRCNADCEICGRRFWTGAPPPDMSRELALRLVELRFIERVCLGQYGEPTLWPHLAETAARAHELGKYCWTTTNGSLLDNGKAYELLEAGIDKVILSIDAIDPEVYGALRVNLNWFRVLSHLDRFIALRNTGFQTRIVVNCVRSPENANRSEADIRAFWLRRGVDGVAFTPEIDVSPRPGTVSGPPIECERPYRHLTVRVDGQLMLCCRDCHGVPEKLGSVLCGGELEAYNSLPFTKLRNALESGQNVPAICRGCRAHWQNPRRPVRAPR
jgi:MoaA/NifB/PqqE/SkfB family radical SAM enzyme